MTAASLSADRRLGVVQALVAGPPPRVSITIGDDPDPTRTVDVAYQDSYSPAVGDSVVLLSNQGGHYVLGRAATGATKESVRLESNVGSITTSEVTLVTCPPLQGIPVGSSLRVEWAWDSVLSSAAGDRLGIRIKVSFNGGAYTRCGRSLIRLAAAADAGGSGMIMLRDQAAGDYTFRAVAIVESGAGTATVNAGDGTATSPFVLTAERWA